MRASRLAVVCLHLLHGPQVFFCQATAALSPLRRSLPPVSFPLLSIYIPSISVLGVREAAQVEAASSSA
jgi:hypothetical protein